MPIQRHTALTVRLQIPDFEIEDDDTIYWVGEVGNSTFRVTVPSDIEVGSYVGMVCVFVSGLQIARLHFDVEVGLQECEADDITSDETRIKSAFASYASEDRDEVLGCIQGMLKILPDLDIFLDIASLRSGENWEKRLNEEIAIRDIFYLFWSRAASRSRWVQKEWRTALSTKGIDYIDPVPLVSPSEVPPPAELASLHFNEWTLPYRDLCKQRTSL